MSTKTKSKHSLTTIIIGSIILALIAIVVIMIALIALAIYIPVRLIVIITNKTSDVIRRKGKTLYVPVVNLYNKRTQQRITFLGCIHIGNNGYYRTLEHIIAQNPHATVLCEGKKDTFTDQDKIAKHPYTLLANMMGMVTQFTMQYQEHWEYNDLDEKLDQLSRIMKFLSKKQKDGKTLEDQLRAMKPKEKEYTGKLLSWLLMNMTFFSLIGKLRKKKWKQRVIDHVILDMRNEHAINEVDKRKDAHIILLWGAAHYPGMKSLLMKRGFEQTDRDWIPALTRQ